MTRGYVTYEIQRSPRWNTFLAGLVINAVGVGALTVFPPTFTSVESRDPISNSTHLTLVAPTLQAPPRTPEPRRVARVELRKRTPVPPPEPVKVPTARVEPRQPELPRVETAKVELPKPERPRFESAVVNRPSPQKQVSTNLFDSKDAHLPIVRKPARAVQTGGFGDPEGIAGQGDPRRNTVTVASSGSFDLPEGAGKGNGTGGSHGVTGVIRSAGFSDSMPSNAPVRATRNVAPSGFASTVAPATSTAALPSSEKKPFLLPVEIVYKPRPVYTEEARRRRVEGEVLLDVVFEASGSLHVNRVVKGLGYGLDDNALAAARRIQFRPARRDGQPYDCAALVHIVFELSE